MRKILIVCLMALITVGAVAQNKRKHFDPHRFQMDLEHYIIQKVGISPTEAARFFPLYREMQKKQRALLQEMRLLRNVDPNDDDACENALRKMDNIDIQIRKIQKEYHQKFMGVLPAGKVLSVLKAEEQFHRQAFKRAVGHEKDRR